MDEILASIRQIISDQTDEADLAAAKAVDEVANPETAAAKVDSIIGSVAADHWQESDVVAPKVSVGTPELRKPVSFDDLVEPETDAAPEALKAEDELGASLEEALSKAVAAENPYADIQADIHAAVNARPVAEPVAEPVAKRIPASDSALDRLIARRSGGAVETGHEIESASSKAVSAQDLELLRKRNDEIRQAAVKFTEEQAASTVDELKAPVVNTPVPAKTPASASILSNDAKQSMNASFERLALSMLEERKGEMDRMMVDIMRPMLKSWLEDNLPSLVERLVREEIERVSRGVH